ncbi:MAG: hypothetical protein ASARMPREDX12_002366 [Alectoria sarmentosa]|nr:MAG: hypothetical protein ASARMPREDX12_002366 [Alectoria sarmentosa]
MDAFLSAAGRQLRHLEEMGAELRSDPETKSLSEGTTDGVMSMAEMRQALDGMTALYQNPQYRTIDQITGNNLRQGDMTETRLMESYEEARPDSGRTITTARREAPQKVQRILDNFEFRQRDAYLLPYVNLEDLSAPKNLMLLLDARSQHTPDVFAWSDSSTSIMANTVQAVHVPRVVGHSMLLTGQSTRYTYGTIVSWSQNKDAAQDMYVGRGFHLGEGLLLLEIQDKLMSFLVRCTELLLQDMDLSDEAMDVTVATPNSSWSGNKEPAGSEATEWRSMMEANTEAAYQVPQQFAVERLRRLAAAKRDEAEDELWAIREDPAYFQEMLQDRYQENCELARKACPGDTTRSVHLKMEMHSLQEACRNVIEDVYKCVVIWDVLLTDLEGLERLKTRFEAVISATSPLPDEYHEALAKFGVVERMAEDYARMNLRMSAAASQPLQQYYSIKGPNPFVCTIDKSSRIPPILNLIDDVLNDDRSQLLGVPRILDEIEYLIRDEVSQRALITPSVAKKLSEVAAFGEINQQMNQHQPKIQTSKYESTCAKHFEECADMSDRIHKILPGANLSKYSTPISRFDYPSSKKRTQQTVEKMRLEEEKLDEFWQRVDDHFIARCGNTLHHLMQNKITARGLQRTPPWQAPERVATAKASLSTDAPLHADPFHSRQPQEEPALPLTTQVKTKPKTRGEADPSRGLNQTSFAEPEDPSPPGVKTFKLSNRAYKVMSALFPSSTQERTTGKIVWKEFVHAFYKLDFDIRSLDGSAWYFEPTWKRDSPITFHEPHPTGEIPFANLRRYASRLTRKYGWGSETFIVA